MISIYRFIYLLLMNLLKLSFPFCSQKMQAWIKLRDSKSYLDFKSSNHDVYLIHAASGEIEYAKAFIRELRKIKPQSRIVVSYSSPSAPKLFKNITEYVNYFFPIPWDSPSETSTFLKSLNPKALIFSRTDLWPEFIYQAHKLNIPMSVISYNPSFSSANRLVTDLFYRPIQNFFCVTKNQADELKKLLPHSTIIADGDTRFDQVFWRLSQTSLVNIQTDRPLLVWGSTWPEDEKELISTLPWIKQHNYQLIWSPHEFDTHKITMIKTILNENKLSYELFSNFNLDKQSSLDLAVDVLIIDKIGYLADFYRFASAAFVGGSFKRKVHSVMEPLCCGLPVLTGPLVENNPEALRYAHVKINDLPMVSVCQNHQQIQQSLEDIQQHDLSEYKKIAKTQLEKNKGLAEKQVLFVTKST